MALRKRAFTLALASLSLAACTISGEPATEIPPTTATSKSGASIAVTAEPTTSSMEAPVDEAPSESEPVGTSSSIETPVVPSVSDSSAPPIVTGTVGQIQNLTLDQAIHSTGWSEKIDTPVGQGAQQVKQSQVTCSSNFSSSDPLEYRFSEASGTLAITVQQALSSDTSDGIIEVAVFVDGRQSLQQLGFKDARTFTVPLTGVNAVKVAVRGVAEKSGACPGYVTALLTNLSITS